MHLTQQYKRQPPPWWLITFDLMTFLWRKRKQLFPFKFSPHSPSGLSVCASLWAFQCLSTQSILILVFAFTPLFFCSFVLSQSPSALFLTFSHFFLSHTLSNSSRIPKNRTAAWGADLLAVIGSPCLPMRCELVCHAAVTLFWGPPSPARTSIRTAHAHTHTISHTISDNML